MIKQIEFSTWDLLAQHLEKATSEGYSHFVYIDQNSEIYQSMLEAVTLKPVTIVADYTINQQYLNDCRYFGKSEITFNDWMDNLNHFPNIIFHIETTQKIINKYTVNNIFDLALLSLLQDDVATDSHVVFNFKQPYTTSDAVWDGIQAFTPLNTTKFNLNKLAFEHKHTVPFKNSETLAPNNDDIRFTDKVLENTKFKLPHWIYNLIHQHYEKKHDEFSYTRVDEETGETIPAPYFIEGGDAQSFLNFGLDPGSPDAEVREADKIGRASCRERV